MGYHWELPVPPVPEHKEEMYETNLNHRGWHITYMYDDKREGWTPVEVIVVGHIKVTQYKMEEENYGKEND